MLFGLLRALARIGVTVAYAVILTGVTTAMAALGPRVQDRVVSHASTNLHNLSHGHLGPSESMGAWYLRVQAMFFAESPNSSTL